MINCVFGGVGAITLRGILVLTLILGGVVWGVVVQLPVDAATELAHSSPLLDGNGEGAVEAFEPGLSMAGALPEDAIGLVGEPITWTITITNNGLATGYDVDIADTLPSELRIDDVSTARGTAAVSGQTVRIYIPYLNPGETVQMQIATTVLSSPPDGVIDNAAVLSSISGGIVVTRRASDTVNLMIELPATGYPRNESADHESDGTAKSVWYALFSVLLLGGLYTRVTRSNRRRQ